jgi:hydroxymethylbilane synthase
MKTVKLGTRGSKLALWQARYVKEELESLVSDLQVDIEIVKTEGDARHDLSPGAFGKEGIFTAELDHALLEKRIDLAVHSLKDLPTRVAKGLTLAAVTERGATSDTLILHRELVEKFSASWPSAFNGRHSFLEEEALGKRLPQITIGTASLRRQALLKRFWPAASFIPLRGNLDTRVRKLDEREVDAIVVATIGLHRLALNTHGHGLITLEAPWYLPAAGQAALAIVTRAAGPTREIAAVLNHEPTVMVVAAERKAMARLGAGCRLPAGFLATIDGITLTIEGVVASADGRTLIQGRVEGEDVDYEDLGWKLGEDLLEQGAAELLKELPK